MLYNKLSHVLYFYINKKISIININNIKIINRFNFKFIFSIPYSINKIFF